MQISYSLLRTICLDSKIYLQRKCTCEDLLRKMNVSEKLYYCKIETNAYGTNRIREHWAIRKVRRPDFALLRLLQDAKQRFVCCVQNLIIYSKQTTLIRFTAKQLPSHYLSLYILIPPFSFTSF